MSTATRIKPLMTLNGKAALNAEEACQFLGGIARSTLDSYSNARIIRSVKMGGRRMWLVSDLEAYLQSLR